MESKTLFFNKTIIKHDLKQYGWVAILSFLVLLFTMPIKVLLLIPQEQVQPYFYREIFRFDNSVIYGICILIPIIVAALLFRFLNIKKAAHMIHSFPFTRKELFFSHFLSGIIILVLPILFIGMMMILLKPSSASYDMYKTIDVYIWMGNALLLTVSLYAIGLFAFQLTGSTIAGMVFTYIGLVLPFGLISFTNELLYKLVYGYSINNYFDYISTIISPMIMYREMHRANIQYGIYLLFISFFFLFPLFAYLLYKKRKIEVATDIIAYNGMKPIFIYGVAYCSSLLGALYLGVKNSNWVFIGFFIGGFLGYFIAQMINNKSFGVIKAYKGFIGYCMFFGIAFLAIHFDWFGYENKIPDINKIKNVSYKQQYEGHHEGIENEIFIKDVVAFHKQIIGTRDLGEDIIYVTYELKNGRKISREYRIPLEEYAAYIQPLEENEIYKKVKNKVFQIEEEDIERIQINNEIFNKEEMITDKNEMRKFIDLLKKDIMEERYEDMKNDKQMYTIDLFGSDEKGVKKHIAFQRLSKYYVNAMQWLKETEKMKNIEIKADEIEYIEVRKTEGEGKEIEIRDPRIIELCLKEVDDRWRGKTIYNVFFYFKGVKHMSGCGNLNEDTIPLVIKDKL